MHLEEKTPMHNLKSPTIRTQLTIAFFIMLTLLIGTAATSITSYLRQFREFENYVNGVRARSDAAHAVREAIDLRAIAARNLVLVTNAGDIAVELNTINKAQIRISSELNKLQQLAQDDTATDEVRRQIGVIAAIEARYSPVAHAVIELARNDRRDEAILKMNNECRPLLASLVAVSDNYAHTTSQRSATLIAEAEAHFVIVRDRLIWITIFAITIAIVTGRIISKRLIATLGAEPATLCDAVARIANGDLTGKLNMMENDKSSVIAALHVMQRELSTTVTAVRSEAENVATSAAEISSGNSDLSDRTVHQASSLEKTTASMGRLTTAVLCNAENARQASELAMAASTIAAKGGQVVAQVVDTMDSISDASFKMSLSEFLCESGVMK